MSYGSDAADQVMRLTLDGVEVAAKLTAKAAERLAKMIYAVIKDQKRTKGKVTLTNMIKSGKPIKIFAIHDEKVPVFLKQAKKYGVMFCVLKDNDANDGLTDIMIREEDVGKVNRIFERFDLAVVDMGELKGEIEKSREQDKQADDQEAGENEDPKNEQEDSTGNPDTEKESSDTGESREGQDRNPEANTESTGPAVPEPPPEYARTRSDRINEFLDRMEGSTKNEQKKEAAENPTDARAERPPQSGRSSGRNEPREEKDLRAGEDRYISSAAKRPSVKKALEELRNDDKTEAPAAVKENVHIKPKKKRRERRRDHGHVRE